jgi:hypothetical protein
VGTELFNAEVLTDSRTEGQTDMTKPIVAFSNYARKIKIYSTVTVPADLYGCETWYLTLRKVHSLRGLKNREIRRIFGPRRRM